MAESCGYRVVKWFVPKPIHPPVWAQLVGHYYQYPSPVILDWKRHFLRQLFYFHGKIESGLKGKTIFGPDLMFIVKKTTEKAGTS